MARNGHLLGLVALATLAWGSGCGSAPAQGAASGEYLYSYCAACHGEAGEGSELVGAPAIAGLPGWYLEAQLHKFKDGARGAHADDKGGLKMRPMARTMRGDDDIKTVSAYVEAMPAAPRAASTLGGDAAKGQANYAVCATCHGADGAGNQAQNAPPLTHQQDWYLLTQLKHFKGGVRGANPKDSTGAVMRGMSNTLTDEAAMKDVIAHIQTLGK